VRDRSHEYPVAEPSVRRMDHGRQSSFNMDGGIHEVPIAGVEGRLWVCGKHLIAPKPDVVLSDTRASHVVCLVKEHELAGRFDEYIVWLRESGRATWAPTSDFGFDPLDKVLALFEGVFARLTSGESVVVHCAAGKGRAGTFASALCVMAGMGVDDAVAHVRRHRPGAGPEAGEQREILDELARRLSR